jgi:hypothetical protein
VRILLSSLGKSSNHTLGAKIINPRKRKIIGIIIAILLR